MDEAAAREHGDHHQELCHAAVVHPRPALRLGPRLAPRLASFAAAAVPTAAASANSAGSAAAGSAADGAADVERAEDLGGHVRGSLLGVLAWAGGECWCGRW